MRETAVVVLLLAIGCVGSDEQSSPDALQPGDATRAKAIYASQNCGMCHGSGDEGTPAGPALVDLEGYWTVDRLDAYLADPSGFREANPDFEARRSVEYSLAMPAYDRLDPDDRRALARWLISR